jgi:phage tail sheath gpL-like
MSIQVTGIPSGYATPGDYFQISFGVGPAVTGQGSKVLLIGDMTSAGDATAGTVVYGPNTLVPLQSETDVINRFGTGSELHRMWRRFRLTNKTTQLFAIAVTDPGGTAGSTTLAIANTATANGTLRIWVGDEAFDTSIKKGDVIGTIGANAVIAGNNVTDLPVTCTFSTPNVVVTSRQTGPRANEIRVRAAIINTDGTIATTVTPNNTSTALTSGATADSWTTALGTILPTQYDYIVSPSTDTAGTTYDDLVTQVLSQALPATGIRQRVIAASIDTQANASTVAANAAINTPLSQIAWLQASEWTAGEIAAHVASVMSQFEDQRWSYNFRDFGKGTVGGIDTSQFWKIPAPFDQTKWPTATSIETALNNGLMPIGVVSATGGTYIVEATTTKHKNGSNFDYRVRSSHIVSVLFRWTAEVASDAGARFGAKSLISDPKNGDPVPSPEVVYPRLIKNFLFEKLNKYANVYFKRVDLIKQAVEVERDPDNNSRLGWRIPARVIDLLLQNVISIDDVSSTPG